MTTFIFRVVQLLILIPCKMKHLTKRNGLRLCVFTRNMSYIRRSRPLVICGPSGSGKSTLIQRMLDEFPDTFSFSTSHTTRKPRNGEIDGQHYHFTTKDEMREAIKNGYFLESAEFAGNLYGTSKMAVNIVQSTGKICILDIDVQGVIQVKRTTLNPWYVFVKPPSLIELERRLIARKTESNESLQLRLKVAKAEIDYGTAPGNFHCLVINDNLDNAYNQFREFLLENVL